MFSLISDQTFIFQKLEWNLHQAELTQAELLSIITNVSLLFLVFPVFRQSFR